MYLFHPTDSQRKITPKIKMADSKKAWLLKIFKPSRENIEFKNSPKGLYAVFKADFFTLLPGAGVISNGHLENRKLGAFREFGNYLRLYFKTVGLYFKRLKDVASDNLITCFHVGKIQTAENIGKNSNHSVNEKT